MNGLRIAGGQEIGMACDFSIASDLARFGQAGPRHGSAPDGGSTDFLHLYVGVGQAIESCTICEPWSAYKAVRLGLINRVVPVLVHQGRIIPNPQVITDRWIDDTGSIVYGEFVKGAGAKAAKELFAASTIDLGPLDQAVEETCTKLLYLMPECTIKTLESLRKKKLEHWQRNCETNRAWLALNMMTEGRAGFKAYNDGPPDRREVDFIESAATARARRDVGRSDVPGDRPAARRDLRVRQDRGRPKAGGHAVGRRPTGRPIDAGRQSIGLRPFRTAAPISPPRSAAGSTSHRLAALPASRRATSTRASC